MPEPKDRVLVHALRRLLKLQDDGAMPSAGGSGTRLKAAPSMRRPIKLPWKKSDPGECLRDTGIALMGKIPWGSHICMFCETKQDVLDAMAEYFTPAATANEYCVWVVSDPIAEEDAVHAVAKVMPDLERRRQEGSFEFVSAKDWYYDHGRFDFRRSVNTWHKRIDDALAQGFAGVRAAGNPFWRSGEPWGNIVKLERNLDAMLAERRIIMLCTYPTERSRPEDVIDVGRAHQCLIARRRGHWQFLKVLDSVRAKQEIELLNDDLDVLPKRFREGGPLTEREQVVLAQVLRGGSSKEVARKLGISPRTVDFHRSNTMEKLGAKNTADLVRRVMGAK